jgi:hypothetical protein
LWDGENLLLHFLKNPFPDNFVENGEIGEFGEIGGNLIYAEAAVKKKRNLKKSFYGKGPAILFASNPGYLMCLA